MESAHVAIALSLQLLEMSSITTPNYIYNFVCLHKVHFSKKNLGKIPAILSICIMKLEDLKVLRRSPDLFNNVKIGQGLAAYNKTYFVLPYMGVAAILVKSPKTIL